MHPSTPFVSRSLLLVVGILFCGQVSTTVSAFSLQTTARKTNVIAGGTGYIGKSVVRESVRQGYNTIVLVRDKSKVEAPDDGKEMYGKFFKGAQVVECDVTDSAKLTKVGDGIAIITFLFSSFTDKARRDPRRTLFTLHITHASYFIVDAYIISFKRLDVGENYSRFW
jgi:uncharacterized protein YbjT (DUF2867 family)